MAQKFRKDQIVYMIASGRRVAEVVIVSYSSGFYVVRYRGSSGGLRVRESRLYTTKEDAEKIARPEGNTTVKEANNKDQETYTEQATEKYYS